MKFLIILAILFMLTVQDVVLLASSTTNTIITYPVGGTTVVEESYHNQNTQNHLYTQYGARWLWKSGGTISGQIIIVESRFYASCKQIAWLGIGADDTFTATLNGGTVMKPKAGAYWSDLSYFELKNIVCGRPNVLKVIIKNQISPGFNPAGVIFTIFQDQSGCFNCLTPLSFYNIKTCKCQCINGCNFTSNTYNSLMKWYDYPTCGCKCKSPQSCLSKQRYWNEATCRCQCKPIYCLPGYQQHLTKCYCKKACPEGTPKVCPQGKYPDEVKCKCRCKYPVSCLYGYFNQETCQCNYWNWNWT